MAAQPERSLAPDIARGLMLALIALANVMIYLYGRPYGLRQHIVERDVLDRVTTFLMVTFVDGRAYPLFAALFGYGIVRIADRLRSEGASERTVSAALRRRSVILIGFGFVHALVAFSGDVLGWYGLIGVVLAARTRMSDRALLTMAAGWLVVASALQGLVYANPEVTDQRGFLWSYAIDDPAEAAAWRLVEWLMTPFGLLSVVSAVLVGMWAGRHRILERPSAYRRLLRVTATTGILAGIVGGVGMAAATVGIWTPPFPAIALLSWAHILTGVLAGFGTLALIAILVPAREPGPVMRALQATGRRSLSAYLAQTVVFAMLLPAHTLGWGATLGTAGAAALALCTWLTTVAVSAGLERRGLPGPAERLMRRLRRINGSAGVTRMQP
ncbi:DUF418 domain-containing protein [Leucobacter sp. wl10]|uniref:DUF418 domain-containing protein n=1 Tax=Leucobacter sp. wl10 TaxID=2304677 RepID=UPI001968DD3F|nr:DUF418 domain-containing protein [Leucobacter sp. wl10]